MFASINKPMDDCQATESGRAVGEDISTTPALRSIRISSNLVHQFRPKSPAPPSWLRSAHQNTWSRQDWVRSGYLAPEARTLPRIDVERPHETLYDKRLESSLPLGPSRVRGLSPSALLPPD